MTDNSDPYPKQPVFPGQIPYESEWLHNKAKLRSVEPLPGHIQDILNSGLSYSCKNILINRSLILFSNIVMLSNLTPVKQTSGLFGMVVQNVGYNDKMAEIDFELMILTDRVGYRRSDLSNSNLLRIESLQTAMFQFILTRTKGLNREGLEQHHMTMRSEQTISASGMNTGQNPYIQQQQQQQQQQSEKKKWFGLF